MSFLTSILDPDRNKTQRGGVWKRPKSLAPAPAPARTATSVFGRFRNPSGVSGTPERGGAARRRSPCSEQQVAEAERLLRSPAGCGAAEPRWGGPEGRLPLPAPLPGDSRGEGAGGRRRFLRTSSSRCSPPPFFGRGRGRLESSCASARGPLRGCSAVINRLLRSARLGVRCLLRVTRCQRETGLFVEKCFIKVVVSKFLDGFPWLLGLFCLFSPPAVV